MKKTNIKNGSALVFSLVVMSLILVAALGAASVSVIEQKNASVTGKSTQAFQVADSAVEIVMKSAITDPLNTDLNEIATGWTCDGGMVSGTISGNPVKLKFLKLGDDGTGTGNLKPVEVKDCATTLSDVLEVQSIGSYAGTTRSVGTAVAAGSLSWNSVSFKNGWSNHSGFQEVQYAKDSRTGIVYLRGTAKSDSLGAKNDSVVFTLPDTTGFRPLKRLVFANLNPGSTYTVNRADVLANGDVIINSGNTEYALFDGISFATN